MRLTARHGALSGAAWSRDDIGLHSLSPSLDINYVAGRYVVPCVGVVRHISREHAREYLSREMADRDGAAPRPGPSADGDARCRRLRAVSFVSLSGRRIMA